MLSFYKISNIPMIKNEGDQENQPTSKCGHYYKKERCIIYLKNVWQKIKNGTGLIIQADSIKLSVVIIF